jgi:probable F420-dependent oxidoreductase
MTRADGTLQIGTFLPTYWASYGTRTLPQAIAETAQAADALGYASLWANDHVIAPASQAEMGHIVEPLITLASVAALVPRLALGTSTLVLPQRHAVVVAKQVAALDALSGGRVTLGIGVGWLKEEFGMLGADFAHRGAVADEAIAVLRALWHEPQATFHGRHYDLTDAVCEPKPAHEVPIWMCGNTRAAIRRAARLCDGWDPFGIELEEFRAGVALLRRLAEAEGRPMPTVAAHLRLFIREGEQADAHTRDAHVAGSVETVAAVLQEYRRAGLEYLICDFVAADVDDLLRQMRLMAEQIAPALTATA